MSCALAGSNTPAGGARSGYGPSGTFLWAAAKPLTAWRALSAGVRLPEPPAAGLARLTGSPAVVVRAVTRRAWRA